jgi:hypothetical protein
MSSEKDDNIGFNASKGIAGFGQDCRHHQCPRRTLHGVTNDNAGRAEDRKAHTPIWAMVKHTDSSPWEGSEGYAD